ncbi:MAG: T9SS C-terminal target domain-containing protein [Candidatus Zixiibacteriota bacterium]|nr:MAG: T9SS C-terminal target domain-containing protein [candidate division Zixibacteria bacterium]
MRTVLLSLLALALTAGAWSQNTMTHVGTWEGEGPADYFGGSMTCGDFNGDGYEDMLIGAGGWANDVGKNYLYLGGPTWPIIPFLTIQGTYDNERYDWSNANLGDFNGDGWDDFAIPAQKWVYDHQAKVDVFFGGDLLDTLPDWTYWAPMVSSPFEWLVDSCGDVNGDGGKDLIVLESAFFAGDMDTIRLFWGGAALDTAPDWIYIVHDVDVASIHGAGDVNGDEFSDLLFRGSNGPTRIFFGGSPMDTIPDVVIPFTTYGNHPGTPVRDFNGDGYDDIALCKYFTGITYPRDVVYFGGADMDTVPDLWLLNWDEDSSRSVDAMTCGDFNGDGYGDLAGTGGESGYAAVRIWLGGPHPTAQCDATIYGNTWLDFGYSLGTGDLDGDGCDELLIAEKAWDFNPEGTVYLFDGPETWIDYGDTSAVAPHELQRHPGWFALAQNYPNPFNAATTIHFDLGKPSNVSLTLYDLTGQRIKNLIDNKSMMPGGYNVSWMGKNDSGAPVASGMYLLELQVDQYRQTKKVILMK